MWFYNGVPYMCEPEDIVTKIRQQCLLNGNDILRDMKVTTNAIMFTCPWHKNGQEKKASCGLITKQKSNDSIPVGKVHCFTCHKVTSLEEFISNCFGIYDGGIYGAKWLAANFTQIEVNNRPSIDLSNTLSRDNTTNNVITQYVSEEELDSYRYIHPYMYQRKLTDDLIEKFDIGYDRNFILSAGTPPMECITFPVRDINGNCLFVGRRAIYTKLFHYPDSSIKPIYGLYELSQFAPKDLTTIYITESMLNAITIWRYGKYAIALNGTGSTHQIEELKKLKYRKIILALDPDEAGILGSKKIYEALKETKIITRLKIPQGKDINDLSEEEFNNLQEFFMNENINF